MSLDIQSFWLEPPLLDMVTGSMRGMMKVCRGYCSDEDETVKRMVGWAWVFE